MDALALASKSHSIPPRYIMVSAIDVRDRDTKPTPPWYNDADKARSDKTWGAIGTYMLAKLAADKALVQGNAERGLEYTIVRPSGLTDEKGSGMVAVGEVGCTRSVSREDVAGVLVAVVDREGAKGCVFDVVGGDGRSDECGVEEGVERVVREKIDCFEGFY